MSDFAALAAKAKEDGPPKAAQPNEAAEAAGVAKTGPTGQAGSEEESTAQFEPVVQLDEVAVKTHEEDEDILWKMRAKLFVFGETLLNKGTGQKEWVERGIGEIKFLQHKESRMVRVLMRQEKTMKVICNHVADQRIVLKPNAGSDRSWVWNAFDFTEGKLEEITFAVRFGSTEAANEFQKQFSAAQEIVKAIVFEQEEAASATEEKKSPEADAAADALKKLSVGAEDNTPAEVKAPADA